MIVASRAECSTCRCPADAMPTQDDQGATDRPTSTAVSLASWRSAAGFTLLELLVLLVILASMTALALPRFSAQRPMTLQRQADAIATDLARLRQEAMYTGEVQIADSAALAAKLPSPFELRAANPTKIVFWPNGTANGAVWEIAGDSGTAELKVDWLTGQIEIAIR